MSARLARILWVPGVLVLATACVIDYHTAGPTPTPEHVEVQVNAKTTWTDTGIDVWPGQQLTIRYLSGEWSPWPGGYYDATGFGGDPRCDCNRIRGVSHASLIARIGRTDPFFVGSSYAHTIGESGRLLLGINDTRLNDNSGSLLVSIEVR